MNKSNPTLKGLRTDGDIAVTTSNKEVVVKNPTTINGVEIHTDKSVWSIHGHVVTFEDGTKIDISAPSSNVPGVELKGNFDPKNRVVANIRVGLVAMSSGKVERLHFGPEGGPPKPKKAPAENEVSGFRKLLRRMFG